MESQPRVLERPDVVSAALVALVAGVLMGLQILTMSTANSPSWLQVPLVFQVPESRAEAMVARMDGHFTAEIAADPTLDRTKRDFVADPSDGAYRAGRPVMGWLSWGFSAGGQRPLLAPAILLLTAASAGALTLAVAALARSWSRRPHLPWLVTLAPGAAVAVYNPGLTEMLAVSLALAGWVADRRGRRGVAVALFAVAVLTRETTILIPAALALSELIQTRRMRLWRLVSVAVPTAVYLGWNTAVAQLLDVSSRGGASNQLSLPGVGLFHALPQWTGLEISALALLLIGAVAAWRTGDHTCRTVVAVSLAFASIMGSVVWAQWWAFSRPMLPIMALAVAGLGQLDSSTDQSALDVEPVSVPVLH